MAYRSYPCSKVGQRKEEDVVQYGTGRWEDAEGLCDTGRWDDLEGLFDTGRWEDAEGLCDTGTWEDAEGLKQL